MRSKVSKYLSTNLYIIVPIFIVFATGIVFAFPIQYLVKEYFYSFSLVCSFEEGNTLKNCNNAIWVNSVIFTACFAFVASVIISNWIIRKYNRVNRSPIFGILFLVSYFIVMYLSYIFFNSSYLGNELGNRNNILILSVSAIYIFVFIVISYYNYRNHEVL
jgi:hypothetical protein